MNNEKITCQNCGQAITRERISLENLIKCPVCDDILPLDRSRTDDASRLKVRQNRSLNEDYQTCPSCEALNPENATLCTRCGYNFVTGEKMKTVYQKKQDFKAWRNPLIIASCILGLVILWFIRSTGVGTNSAPPPVENDMKSLQQADFERWKQEFEQSYPVLKTGDDITLELKTGRVIRAQIVETKPAEVILISAMGRETVALANLTLQSKVQISMPARQQMIEMNRKRIFGN